MNVQSLDTVLATINDGSDNDDDDDESDDDVDDDQCNYYYVNIRIVVSLALPSFFHIITLSSITKTLFQKHCILLLTVTQGINTKICYQLLVKQLGCEG